MRPPNLLTRSVLAGILSTCVVSLAAAQVPGTVGPPPDSRFSPGTEGPTLACRLFDFGCKPAVVEPAAAPPAGEAIAPAARKTKAKGKAKPKAAPAADPDE